ncbi:MAG: DNA-binding response regulator [Verrucomicrobiia bacterium Tous-C4TDCM]|nr:MAG: DNA-binding response regulator [Verrucomicrobiae bacterium Tous-C4TDCM]
MYQRPMNPTCRILLVDDHYVVRIGMASSLNLEPDLEVVAEAENGEAAIALYREHRPDLVILDWRLPDLSGGDVIKALHAEFPAARVLVLSAFESEEVIYQALQAGAVGYLAKSSRRPELIGAVRLAAQGKAAFSADIAAKLASRIQRPSLSPRELEVVAELVKGNSNKEIATRLNISENTVKLHITHIMQKLRAKDRTHVASIALQQGLLENRAPGG